MVVEQPTPIRSRRHHSFGFWVAAAAFLVNMGFSAVPTPLYALYRQRDHFSTFMVTVVYAVYAIGVIGSLFLGGHVSDWVGRKRVFVPALLINVASALLFLFLPSLPGLLIARVVTRYLRRTHDRDRHRVPRGVARREVRLGRRRAHRAALK